jgi:hypothetical protein
MTKEQVKEYFDKILSVAVLVSSLTKTDADDKVVEVLKNLEKIPFIFEGIAYLLNLLEKKNISVEELGNRVSKELLNLLK